ncbi:MAG: tRNA 4-thiouridine(8) synthase ThiI [Desulfobacteraceae bacterium 4572_88]|nr:MAG: tRNA 4-thiouridine(8) synthase ThiI [Desulfobacteraceae bacterium 4572_88]
MSSDSKKIRALGLCSGGLDSILSALVLREQGIVVEWITFETPFFSSDKAGKASQHTGVPLTVRNITLVYLEMLRNPRCGYGQHMNPCLDCHALMFRLAGKIMQDRGFHFLFSGEVVGQRPMSQTKPSLRYVEKHSGFDGHILRPLSAQKLPPTLPEEKGWVDKAQLLGLSGRSRKPQMELAKQFGITDYPAPAGGCLLTDKGFSLRLKDIFSHQTAWTENELHLLRYGRHFRLDDQTKIIVGSDTIVKVKNFPGPTVLVPGGGNPDQVRIAASACVGYSKAPNEALADVTITTPTGEEIIQTTGTPSGEISHFLI